MKIRSPLSFLRGVFFAAEWILLILTALFLFQTWCLSSRVGFRTGGKSGMPFYEFQFTLPEESLNVNYQGDPAASVFYSTAEAQLCAGESKTFSTLWWLERWHGMTGVMGLVFATVVVGLLRRTCDRVRRGETFSAESVDLLWRVGWTYLVYFVFSAVNTNAFNACVASDLRQHITSRLSTSFYPAAHDGLIWFMFGQTHLALDFSLLFEGFLALTLAKIFHEGLVLREDSELTV